MQYLVRWRWRALRFRNTCEECPDLSRCALRIHLASSLALRIEKFVVLHGRPGFERSGSKKSHNYITGKPIFSYMSRGKSCSASKLCTQKIKQKTSLLHLIKISGYHDFRKVNLDFWLKILKWQNKSCSAYQNHWQKYKKLSTFNDHIVIPEHSIFKEKISIFMGIYTIFWIFVGYNLRKGDIRRECPYEFDTCIDPADGWPVRV